MLAEAFGSGSGVTVQLALALGTAVVTMTVTAAVSKALHGKQLKDLREDLTAVEKVVAELRDEKLVRDGIAEHEAKAAKSSAALRRTTLPHHGPR